MVDKLTAQELRKILLELERLDNLIDKHTEQRRRLLDKLYEKKRVIAE